jgi:TetR/AcrR family transcriptional repressor of nem operon
MCGIMAAEREDLPTGVKLEVERFTDVNVEWLTRVLSLAKASGGKQEKEETGRRALAIFAAVEGAQLVARGRGDVGVFDQTIEAYRTAGLLP